MAKPPVRRPLCLSRDNIRSADTFVIAAVTQDVPTSGVLLLSTLQLRRVPDAGRKGRSVTFRCW